MKSDFGFPGEDREIVLDLSLEVITAVRHALARLNAIGAGGITLGDGVGFLLLHPPFVTGFSSMRVFWDHSKARSVLASKYAEWSDGSVDVRVAVVFADSHHNGYVFSRRVEVIMSRYGDDEWVLLPEDLPTEVFRYIPGFPSRDTY